MKRTKLVSIVILGTLMVILGTYFFIMPNSTSGHSNRPARSVIFTLQTEGGYCAGPCDQTELRVFSDGSWISEYASETHRGKYDTRILSNFKAAITDQLNKLEDSKKSEEFCDSWADGSDTEMVFHSGDTKIEISSCDYDLSDFRKIYLIIGEAIGQVEK